MANRKSVMRGLLNFIPKIELLMYLHVHRGCSSLYILVVQWNHLDIQVSFVYPSGFNFLYSLEVSVICICWWFQSSVYSSGA